MPDAIPTAFLLGVVAAFVIPAAINDAKDLTARASGQQVPQCAVWSVTRPACRR